MATYTVNGVTYDANTGLPVDYSADYTGPRNDYAQENGYSAADLADERKENELYDSLSDTNKYRKVTDNEGKSVLQEGSGPNTTVDSLTGTNQELSDQFKKKRRQGQNIDGYLRDWVSINNRRKRKERMNGGVLRYPLEGLTNSTDYLQIDIKRYQPIGKKFVNRSNSGARTVTGSRTSNIAGSTRPTNLSRRALVNDGTILLPIPSNIGDANSVQYNESKLGSIEGELANAATRIMGGGLSGVGDNLKDAANTFLKNAEKGAGSMEAGQDVLLSALASAGIKLFNQNGPSTDELLARSRGETFNPNMELLFKGPTLRKFRFQFKLSPRSHKEAEQCLLILRAFKRNMAPKVFGSSNTGNWFLKTPNVFEIRYRTGSRDHTFLNKFKQCFLTDCATNYTPDGVYATYDDTSPVSMTLDLSFQELVPIYDYDYDNGPGVSAVGY